MVLHEVEERHEFVDRIVLAAPGCRRLHRGRRRLGRLGGHDGFTGDRLGRGLLLHTPVRGRLVGANIAARRLLLGRLDRLPALRAAHRRSRHEHPAHVRNGLATDQPSLVEQPVVLAVELLERVVREHPCVRLVGDAEHERIAAADRAGRRGDQLVVGDGGVERLHFLLRDAMAEGGVDDHRHLDTRIVGEERHHRLVELIEARHTATLGGDVGAVDDEQLELLAARHHRPANTAFMRSVCS